MSWTQGVQPAEELPQWFINIANNIRKDPTHRFVAIAWEPAIENELHLMYVDKDGNMTDGITVDPTPLYNKK